MNKQLIVLTGPTGIGKTEAAIELAKQLGSPIISCDSRQIFREMRIGVARPTSEQLSAVQHYFIACKSVTEYYSVGRYELDAVMLLTHLFTSHDTLLIVGGSGLYIDAVCFGIDETPTVDEALRTALMLRLRNEGLDALRYELRMLDPKIYDEIDKKNPARIVRALEVCLATGKPYSLLRRNAPKPRPFDIKFMVMRRERDELYRRINLRVEQMLAEGLIDEARSLLPFRNCNALKTVGYRELFDYFDGKLSLDEAVALIKQNTRRYAKRQQTWMAKYEKMSYLRAR